MIGTVTPQAGGRIAALPMYDFAELQADNDALWAWLARAARAGTALRPVSS